MYIPYRDDQGSQDCLPTSGTRWQYVHFLLLACSACLLNMFVKGKDIFCPTVTIRAWVEGAASSAKYRYLIRIH